LLDNDLNLIMVH